MKKWLIALGIIGLLSGCSEKQSVEPQTEENTEYVDEEPEVVEQQYTKEMYDQIEMGMSFDKVVEILGDAGEVESESKYDDGGVSKVVKWDNEDATGILLQFDNDKVINMSWN